MRANSVSSAKLSSASNILLLEGKCRYSAASDTPTEASQPAVVMRVSALPQAFRQHLKNLLFAVLGCRGGSVGHGLPIFPNIR